MKLTRKAVAMLPLTFAVLLVACGTGNTGGNEAAPADKHAVKGKRGTPMMAGSR